MKITYLHQYFITPTMKNVGVSGTRSYEIAKRMIRAGHEVNMIAAYPFADKGQKVFNTEEAGICVYWIPVSYSNKMPSWLRIVSFLKFAAFSAIFACRIKCDVIFATSTPLTIAIPAILAKVWKRKPMVFEVRDLWPEAPRELGYLNNIFLYKAACLLEKMAYFNASKIVALSPGMVSGVKKIIGCRPIDVVLAPNASDLEHFSPVVEGSSLRVKLNLENRLVFLYFGTIGPANGLDQLIVGIEDVEKAGFAEKVRFLIVGDGKERSNLEKMVERKKLSSVIFHDPVVKKDIPSLVAACDVSLVYFHNSPILHTCSPNKFFDSLSAGKPIITNMKGWIPRLIRDNNCGFYVSPESPDDLVAVVSSIVNSKADLIEMGRNARGLAERQFSRDSISAIVIESVETAGKVM